MKDSSLDNVKENTSIVGSSLTECKHDIENCDDPGSSSYSGNDECYPVSEEAQVHPFNDVENLSGMRNEKMRMTRYFVIKSLSHHNIQLSIEKGIWATQVMNEPILEEAFHNSGRVILIFSVNMSGFFQGYAQMMSSVGWRRENVWSESSGGSNPWGRTFKVKWLRLQNLPFQKTLHLRNPLNDNKPVKISRDCQELSQDIGEALCGLIDGMVDVDGKLKRNNLFRDEVLLKRPCRESPVPLQQEDFMLSVPSPHMAWAKAPMLYPSLLYQHAALAEVHNPQLTPGRSSGSPLSENCSSFSEAPKSSRRKHSHNQGNTINRQGDSDRPFQLDSKDMSDERNFHSDFLSEEDILDMTYEEYLQVHGRSNESSPHPVSRPSWSVQGPSASTDQDDDRYSKYLADWYQSQKQTGSGYYNARHK